MRTGGGKKVEFDLKLTKFDSENRKGGDPMPKVAELMSRNIANTITNVQTWGGIIYNVKAYGAKGDGKTDDTDAINRTIEEAVSKGGGTVYFPEGHYIVAGDLKNPDIQNAQIPIPQVDINDKQIYLKLQGGGTVRAYEQYSSDEITTSGAIIESRLTNITGHFPSIIGGPRPDKPFTNVTIYVENLTIRANNDPQMTALQLHGTVNAIIENVTCDVNAKTIDIKEPTNWRARGLMLPRWGNDGAVSVKQFYVVGYYVGIHLCEHAKILDSFVQNCKIGLYPEVRYGHPAHIYNILVQSCPYVIAQPAEGTAVDLTGPTSPMPILIDMLDVEEYNPAITMTYGPWPQTVRHIADRNDMLAGHCNYFLSGGTDVNLIVTGAGRLKIKNNNAQNRNDPNLLFNSTGHLGLAGWSPFGNSPSSWSVVGTDAEGAVFHYSGVSSTPLPSQANMVSEKIQAIPGEMYSVQAEVNASMLETGYAGVQVEAYDSSDVFISILKRIDWTKDDTIYTFKHSSFTIPAGASHIKVIQFVAAGTTGPYGPTFRRIHVHYGRFVMDYDDAATFNTVEYPGMFAQYVNNSPKTTINGKTSGTIDWVQDLRGTVKRVVISLNAYVNSAGIADVITFPKAFSKTPAIVTNSASVPGVTVSATQISINPNNSTTYNGYIIIEGF